MSRNNNTSEGLKSEALRAALTDALAGKPKRLEELLVTHSSLPSPQANLKLAAAFGTEVSTLPGLLMPLLSRFAAVDAAPDDAHVFLPIVAAYGFTGRIHEGREVEPSWDALAQLAADERGPVRLGTLAALLAIGVRDGGGDTLVMRGSQWLQSDDRELRFGSASIIIEALGDKAVLATANDHEALFSYLAEVITLIANAPRAADRSNGRRRALMSLPRTLAATASAIRSGARGVEWLREQCELAKQPEIRETLSRAIESLRSGGHGQSAAAIESLRKSLEGSAKPIRDPARVRLEPGQGRGRRSRRVR